MQLGFQANTGPWNRLLHIYIHIYKHINRIDLDYYIHTSTYEIMIDIDYYEYTIHSVIMEAEKNITNKNNLINKNNIRF